jgi:hypothetical protein
VVAKGVSPEQLLVTVELGVPGAGAKGLNGTADAPNGVSGYLYAYDPK